MAISRSLAAEVGQLVAQLASESTSDRESARARLAVIGPRAAEALVRAVENRLAPSAARAGALGALAAMDDRRTAALALAVLDEPAEGPLAAESLDIVRQASVGRGRSATIAFEKLTALALDRTAPAALRLGALEALASHPAALVRPVFDAVANDHDDRVARAATSSAAKSSAAAPTAASPMAASLDLAMQLNPGDALAAVGQSASAASPAALIHAIETARAAEARDTSQAHAWRLLRAALHRELADRNSRLGVYDLRETFERATSPLPPGFVTAMAKVGDRSTLESLARAWQQATLTEPAPASGDDGADSWRTELARTFVAVAGREGIGRQSAVMKKIVSRWPDAAALVSGVPTPARSLKRR